MKRFVSFFVLCMSFVCMLSACKSTSTSKVVNNSNLTKNNSNLGNNVITIDDIINPQVIKETEFYKVLQGEGHVYYYYIFDKYCNVVDEGGYYWKEPQLSIIGDGVVKVYTHLGTGAGAIRTRYYDTENDILSEWFNSVYDESNNLIAYSDHNKLVVRNMFDKLSYYQEFQKFSHELLETNEPFTNVKFINNGTQLEVTYVAADFSIITEIISL